MGRYFSAERVQQLLASQEQVHRQFRELRDKMFLRTYKTERGGEYAKHGGRGAAIQVVANKKVTPVATDTPAMGVPTYCPLPSFVSSQRTLKLWRNRRTSGEGAMHQFSVGQVVTCLPDRFLRHAAPGNYRVIATMPDRDGDHVYRIKSPIEKHERAVRESLLVKSDGYLPEETPHPGSRRRSITLPTLQKM